MPIFQPEDFGQVGGAASRQLKGLAETISNNVCSLYQNAPRGFVGSNPVSDAVNSFNSGFWDDFCGRLPEPKLPPAPSAPFTGGQCAVQYNVVGTCSAANSAAWACGEAVQWNGSISGPGITVVEVNSQARLRNAAGQESPCVMQGSSTQGIFVVPDCAPRGAGSPFAFQGSVTISSVSRSDGLPDDCGNAPAEYPDVSPPPQNPGVYPYVGNDGVERPINFSIDFDPTINGPLVRLPDIPNVCVGFGYGGIEIDLCTNKPGSGTGGDISEIEDKIDALRDILDRLEEDSKENLNKEDTDENPPDQTDPENEPPDGGISKCVPNLRFVKVTLTSIPPNANVEVGQAGFDRIDDAGWFTFTKDGFFFPPQRIEFGGAIFEAPPGVECFTMQLRFGFTAVVTTVVKDN